jgi:N-acetylglucosamine-6-phosphate deacetylase
MNMGEVLARHFVTGEAVRLRWADGVIRELSPTTDRPPEDTWLAPPLVDLQINGYAGVDFQQDDLTLDTLLAATRGLRAAGCTRWLLTLITDEWPRMLARLQQLRRQRAQSPELQEAIAGWHLEGPFLSAEPGYCGAHNPALMRDPALEDLEELRHVAGGDPVLLTLAPERAEAIAVIARAVALGFKVSLGHTNAPHKRLTQAVDAGATGFTHLGNGCPAQLNRHSNILWRVFETPELKVGLIPDTVHVSPPLFRLAHRVLGAEAIYYTSDAMAAADAPPGRYKLGRLELDVGPDQVVRLPGQPHFAGSALRPIEGVFRAAEMLQCPWAEPWRRFSRTPAAFMGLPSGLQAGQPATFCLVEVVPPNQPASLRVFIKGEGFAGVAALPACAP